MLRAPTQGAIAGRAAMPAGLPAKVEYFRAFDVGGESLGQHSCMDDREHASAFLAMIVASLDASAAARNPTRGRERRIVQERSIQLPSGP